mmetsp:Transcript_23719/g.42978  ORF Transcript_23719/g.42978 Transcript_23719/m.42978 type:complete len:664 (+) Transcript_23719:68-2059(+)|eukprot:CAMPEP_0197697932 /NCGR_PEP_ID=MMETSP1338-20131121/118644_1 /TAXON_ID=43686 ORGANISM="Pelagodinium beii, Strain RCC1491" /NCGR_SAMPLE_ID=MMETSP1338 /ASSEMBLY_ACC=CAM_ASM_000754 /LENGTH=663 /DNA_ID=CAMNT_0043281235 /DNA_START=27 /DNA_END=2018 /DNA_ORIENTATION=+
MGERKVLPRHEAAVKESPSAKAGLPKKPQPNSEKHLDWLSVQPKSFLEWSYRSSPFKPKTLGLKEEHLPKRPTTARPASSRRPPGPIRPSSSPGYSRRPQSSRLPPQALKTTQAAPNLENQREIREDDQQQQQGEQVDQAKPSDALQKEVDFKEEAGLALLVEWLEKHTQDTKHEQTAVQLERLAGACGSQAVMVSKLIEKALLKQNPRLKKAAIDAAKRPALASQETVKVHEVRDKVSQRVDSNLKKVAYPRKRSMFRTEAGKGLNEAMLMDLKPTGVRAAVSTANSARRAEVAIDEVFEGREPRQAEDPEVLALVAKLQKFQSDASREEAMPGRSARGSMSPASPSRKAILKQANFSAFWRPQRRGAVGPQGKEPDEVQMRIGAAFGGVSAHIRKMDAETKESLNLWELQQLAIQLNFPFYEVKYCQIVFQELDSNGDGTLDYDEFEKAAVKLVGEQAPAKEVSNICKQQWSSVANTRTQKVNFLEFLQWYSKQKFFDKSRGMEDLSNEYGVSLGDVEQVKLAFDSVDTNRSGAIEMSEFKLLLSQVMRIPVDVELPKSRVSSLWSELDTYGDSRVTFAEFLPWWLKRRDGFLPYESFYASVRQIGAANLDPHPYRKKELDDDEDSDIGGFDEDECGDEGRHWATVHGHMFNKKMQNAKVD